MLLDDLLAVVPGLRKLRRLNADLLRIMLDRSKGQCTWCGQPVGKGRSKWCGEVCVEQFKLRCDSAYQRTFVEKRDGMVCRICGRDITAAKQQLREGRKAILGDQTLSPDEQRRQVAELEAACGFARLTHHEVDHIVPVCEGGGLCGPEGLRLTCGTCHAAETKKLSGRRAKAVGTV